MSQIHSTQAQCIDQKLLSDMFVVLEAASTQNSLEQSASVLPTLLNELVKDNFQHPHINKIETISRNLEELTRVQTSLEDK